MEANLNLCMLGIAAIIPFAGAAAYIPSTPDLGKAGATCSANEKGPALMVTVSGLKDRTGNLKLEVYPSNNDDFLADDNKLVMQKKAFRRIEVPVPKQTSPKLCVRIPAAGNYSLSILHDRDSNRRFGLSVDGIGFSGNPKLKRSKPKAAATRIKATSGITQTEVIMNYRRGLIAFGPIEK